MVAEIMGKIKGLRRRGGDDAPSPHLIAARGRQNFGLKSGPLGGYRNGAEYGEFLVAIRVPNSPTPYGDRLPAIPPPIAVWRGGPISNLNRG